MFYDNPYFYYITIGLQAFCVIHCIRNGNQNKWIWIVIFLPVVGSIAYLFTEILDRNKLGNVQSGVTTALMPGNRIKKLEEQLRFTDTFNNRVMLADAYLAAGQTEKAVTLYESSLTGAFAENEQVMMQLVTAYYETGRFDKLLSTVQKIYRRPQFARSRQHLLYALALDKTGNPVQAETELKMLQGKFSNYESRYEYGMFLARNNRIREAKDLLVTILDEKRHLSGRERSRFKWWFARSKDALKKMTEMQGQA